MANTGFKGVDTRQTGNQLVFRASLKDSTGAVLTTGTTNLRLYEVQSDGTLKSYDWGAGNGHQNTFVTTALSTESQAMTHQTGNNSGTNTGIWTYALSTLTGFTVGSIYVIKVINSGASPTEQEREFQYGSAQGDLVTTANGTGVGELNVDVQFVKGNSATASTSGVLDVNTVRLGNTLQTARDIGLSVLLDFTLALPALPVANTVGEALYVMDAFRGRVNTAQAGTTTTITLDSGASATDNVYNGFMVFYYSGTGGGVPGTGQHSFVTAYNGTTKVATLDRTLATAADSTTKFILFPEYQGVDWSKVTNATSTNVLSGTTINTVTTAPTAAAIVTALLTDLLSSTDFNTSSSFGKLIKDNLDATISSRLATSGYTAPPTSAAIVTALLTDLLSSSDFNTSSSFGKLIKDNLDVVLSTRLATSGYTVPPTSAAIVTALLTDLLSSSDFNTASSFGKLIKDNIDATISSRLATSGYTAPLTPPTAASIVTALLTDLLSSSDFNTSSSFGKLIKDNLDVVLSTRLATSGYTAPPTSAAIVTALLTDLLASSDFSTSSSFGKLIKDNLDATVSSRLASGSYTSPPSAASIVTTLLTDLLSSSDFNTSSSFGKLIKDNIDTTISSRLATSGYTSPPTSAAIVTALLTDLLASSDFSTSSSFGKLIKDNLDTNVGSRSTYAGADTSGTTTLLSRLSAARGGYLDNLNVGGNVASQADVLAINTSSSKHLILTTVGQFERPESGNTVYTVECRTFAASSGNAVNADSTPTFTATGQTSGSLNANVGSVTNPATGVYRATYTVISGATVEPVRFDVSAAINSTTFTLSCYSQVLDEVSQTWTSTDASHLTSIFNKLPTGNIADETDSLSIKAKTDLIATNSMDSPNTITEQTDIATLYNKRPTNNIADETLILAAIAGISGGGSNIPGANNITVTVTDGTNPLQLANVTFRLNGNISWVAQTDTNGVVVAALDPGTYILITTCPGYIGHTQTVIVTVPASLTVPLTQITVTASTPPQVTGFLIAQDANGAVVAGVKHTLICEYAPGTGSSFTSGHRTALSNGAGLVQFTGLTPTNHYRLIRNSGDPIKFICPSSNFNIADCVG